MRTSRSQTCRTESRIWNITEGLAIATIATAGHDDGYLFAQEEEEVPWPNTMTGRWAVVGTAPLLVADVLHHLCAHSRQERWALSPTCCSPTINTKARMHLSDKPCSSPADDPFFLLTFVLPVRDLAVLRPRSRTSKRNKDFPIDAST